MWAIFAPKLYALLALLLLLSIGLIGVVILFFFVFVFFSFYLLVWVSFASSEILTDTLDQALRL